MSHLQRFKYYLKEQGISPAELKKMVSIEPSKVTNYLSGKTSFPRIDFASEILKALPDLSGRYWLLNEGEPIRGKEAPKDAIILSKLEYESLKAKEAEIGQLQQKLINVMERDQKQISELVAWKKETEQDIKELNGNVLELTKQVSGLMADLGEMGLND